jgi:hypothetical protein
MVSDIRGNPDCPRCGGMLTVYGTVNTGPDVSDGEPCLDCEEWMTSGPTDDPWTLHGEAQATLRADAERSPR